VSRYTARDREQAARILSIAACSGGSTYIAEAWAHLASGPNASAAPMWLALEAFGASIHRLRRIGPRNIVTELADAEASLRAFTTPSPAAPSGKE
jgi:hypothetical protein